jgi:hypothetical protein
MVRDNDTFAVVRSFLTCSLLALAACAAPAPQWEKPGASQTAVDEAMQQCRVQVSLSPEQRVGSPMARSGATPAIDRIDDRHAREAQQLQRCMQEKGFSLRRQ